MPLIVFTHTAGALPRDKAINVAEQIRESLIRNYAIKTIPDGLRAIRGSRSSKRRRTPTS